MMFVSVLSTSAFAAAWPTAQVSTTAITEANKSIQNIYGALVADQAVFDTAKTLHDFSDNMAKAMFDGVEKMASATPGNPDVYHDVLVDNARKYMKGIIGDTIAAYINAHQNEFLDPSYINGVDSVKYLNVFAKAVNDAVTSSKAQKGIEALATTLYTLKTWKSVQDKAEDIQKAIAEWGTGKWDEFGANFGTPTDYTNFQTWTYPTLTDVTLPATTIAGGNNATVWAAVAP